MTRFKLRTFLALVALLCIWLGWHVNPVMRQRRAVRALGPRGSAQPVGRIMYDYQWADFHAKTGLRPEPALPDWLLRWLGHDFFYRVVGVTCFDRPNFEKAISEAELEPLKDLRHLRYLFLNNAEITPAVLKSIGRMRKLEELILQSCHFPDEKLEPLPDLPRLEVLRLYGSKLTDDDLRFVSELRSIRSLSLYNTAITDTGLLHLKKLYKIETLRLGGFDYICPTITDAGLAHLQSLKRLRVLHLLGNQHITDAGLSALAELPNLRTLNVSGTNITAAGAGNLQIALPSVQVWRRSMDRYLNRVVDLSQCEDLEDVLDGGFRPAKPLPPIGADQILDLQDAPFDLNAFPGTGELIQSPIDDFDIPREGEAPAKP